MTNRAIVDRAHKLIAKAQVVLKTDKPNPPGIIGFPTLDTAAFSEWETQVSSFLTDSVGAQHNATRKFKEAASHGAYQSAVQVGVGILRGIADDAAAGHVSTGGDSQTLDTIDLVTRICDRFHTIARQLRARHEGRPTLDVEDEYDVQDLVHALLRLHFDDIRKEEYTPSYAAKASKMDFLIKAERFVVEVKRATKGMDAKEIASQLIDDIARYQAHPDCGTLICFVYDPEGLVPNPRGLERDLERPEGALPVRVFIRPL